MKIEKEVIFKLELNKEEINLIKSVLYIAEESNGFNERDQRLASEISTLIFEKLIND